MKKVVLIILTALMLLTAATCSNAGTSQPGQAEDERKTSAGTGAQSSTSALSNGAGADGGEIYAKELIMVPDAEVYLSQAVRAGNSIYMYGKINKEAPILYRMDIESRQFERVELPTERVDTICFPS